MNTFGMEKQNSILFLNTQNSLTDVTNWYLPLQKGKSAQKTKASHRLDSAPWTEMNEVPLLVFLEDLEENTFEDKFGDH